MITAANRNRFRVVGKGAWRRHSAISRIGYWFKSVFTILGAVAVVVMALEATYKEPLSMAAVVTCTVAVAISMLVDLQGLAGLLAPTAPAPPAVMR